MKITVTGGASFIGSHLVDRLLKDGHEVQVIDDYSSGSIDNLDLSHLYSGLKVVDCMDLRIDDPRTIATQIRTSDIVFHLAADHGGRGYVETKQVNCSNNFAIDNNVFQACVLADIPKVVFASSGCVYPIHLQTSNKPMLMLREKDLGFGDEATGMNPDGLYGLAKAAGELTLQEMHREYGIESTSCRFFTVYGPRAKENHAIISFIARAFIRQDPWVLWGNGQQIRNWTYVDDIVQGMILSMDLSGCQALNIGTEEFLTVKEAAHKVINLADRSSLRPYDPEIRYDTTKPVGPQVRVASSAKYRSLGGTFTPFDVGLEHTWNWYVETHDQHKVEEDLERLLIARK